MLSHLHMKTCALMVRWKRCMCKGELHAQSRVVVVKQVICKVCYPVFSGIVLRTIFHVYYIIYLLRKFKED